MKIKLINIFKIIVTSFVVIVFTLTIISCKEAPPVEELVEEPEVEEQQTTTETSLAEEEEQKEEIPPKREEAQIEFNESMINNRFIFPEGIPPIDPRIRGGETVPLWFIQEYGSRQFIASGVVAGPLRKDIGATGEEELLLPVAFQNPATEKFYIRDISYGNNDFFSQLDSTRWFIRVLFEDYAFTIVTGGGNYRMINSKFEEIEPNLIAGNQVAFIFDIDLTPGLEEAVNDGDEVAKIYKDFMDVYIPNNLSVFEAMKTNKDLPEAKLFTQITMFNKAEGNN